MDLHPTIHEMKRLDSVSGNLSVLDQLDQKVFSPKRFFLVSGVPNGVSRGGHAHRICWQFLLAVNGSANVKVTNKIMTQEFELKDKQFGLLVPPLNWLEFSLDTSDTNLLVMASDYFDEKDYIYNLEEILK
jgi:hypothetical protein